MIYYLDDPAFKEEYFTDAWSSFVKKNVSYLTHTLCDINELISDIISIIHLSLNMPDASRRTGPTERPASEQTLSPRRKNKAK